MWICKILICCSLLCAAQSLAQPVFQLDSSGNKFWNGRAWDDVGSEQYESMVAHFDEPNAMYRSGKSLSGSGTVLMYAGGTICFGGVLAGWLANPHESGGKSNVRARKLYIVGAGAFVTGFVLKLIGNERMRESARVLKLLSQPAEGGYPGVGIRNRWPGVGDDRIALQLSVRF